MIGYKNTVYTEPIIIHFFAIIVLSYDIHNMTYLQNQINLIIGGIFTGDSNWNRSTHQETDDCFKIYYLKRGKIVMSDGVISYSLEAEKLYLINGYKLKNREASELFEVQWLHFIPINIILNHALTTLPAVTTINTKQLIFEQLQNNIFDLAFGKQDIISSISTFNELKIQNFIHSTIISALDDYAWNELNDLQSITRIKTALDYIEEHYKEDITIHKLASLTCLSSTHFHKIFVDTMQISPYKYIIRKKMFSALTLLIKNNDIKQTAYELGFCSNAHFSRAFKNYFGFTPSAYKQKKSKSSEYDQINFF